jgi:hypothetical protein
VPALSALEALKPVAGSVLDEVGASAFGAGDLLSGVQEVGLDVVVDDLDDGLAGLAVIAALGCGGYNLGVLVLAQFVQLGNKVVKFRVPKRVIVHFLLAPHFPEHIKVSPRET